MIWTLLWIVALFVVFTFAITDLLAPWVPLCKMLAAWTRPFAWVGWLVIGIDKQSEGDTVGVVISLLLSALAFISWWRRKDDDDNPWKKWRKRAGSALRVVFTPQGRLALR